MMGLRERQNRFHKHFATHTRTHNTFNTILFALARACERSLFLLLSIKRTHRQNAQYKHNLFKMSTMSIVFISFEIRFYIILAINKWNCEWNDKEISLMMLSISHSPTNVNRVKDEQSTTIALRATRALPFSITHQQTALDGENNEKSNAEAIIQYFRFVFSLPFCSLFTFRSQKKFIQPAQCRLHFHIKLINLYFRWQEKNSDERDCQCRSMTNNLLFLIHVNNE